VILWARLRRGQLGFRFRRQDPIAGYIVDFVCHQRGLVIETDGDSHTDREKDARRDRNLARLGYRVLRFWDEDVKRNLDGVLLMISDALSEQKASPACGVLSRLKCDTLA
jgi:crossover junction endodeoxyribonuclease RuvC